MGRGNKSVTPFDQIPALTQFIIFGGVLLVLYAIPATSQFALMAALIVLGLQLLAMSKKGHAL